MGIILLACTSINISQAANFRPESPQSVAKILKAIDGNWYDHNGNLVLQIQDGYINGCKILTVYDLAGASGNGGANFRILESTGERFIMGPLSRPRSKILRVAVSRIILSSEASKVKLVGNLVA